MFQFRPLQIPKLNPVTISAASFALIILSALSVCHFQPTVFNLHLARELHLAIHGVGLLATDLRGIEGQELLVTTGSSFEGFSVRTVLIALHLIGLVLGFGAAVFLDLFLLRYVLGAKIKPYTAEIAHFGARLVAFGLSILWISGIGFLTLYLFETPDKLGNPKIWAKVPIVIALTINGFVIHAFSLRIIEKKIGASLLEGESVFVQSSLLALGVVSATSWAVAMFFGIAKEFNNTVSSATLLSGYALLLASGIALALVVRPILANRHPKPIFQGWKAPQAAP